MVKDNEPLSPDQATQGKANKCENKIPENTRSNPKQHGHLVYPTTNKSSHNNNTTSTFTMGC